MNEYEYALQKSKYRDIIGEYFDYTLDFEFLDIVAYHIDRIDQEDATNRENAIIEETEFMFQFEYPAWKIMMHYQESDNANKMAAFEEMLEDMIRLCKKIKEKEPE